MTWYTKWFKASTIICCQIRTLANQSVLDDFDRLNCMSSFAFTLIETVTVHFQDCDETFRTAGSFSPRAFNVLTWFGVKTLVEYTHHTAICVCCQA